MKTRAIFELILAGALWGFGFVAAVWALESFGPMTITAFRFLIGGLVSFLVSKTFFSLVSKTSRQKTSFEREELASSSQGTTDATAVPNRIGRASLKKISRAAMLPGLWLSLTLVLQTWGLLYTTPTKSGFITTLYVLLVPILEFIWFQKKISRWHWFFVAVAMLGTLLICELLSQQTIVWNKGDILTLLCAVAASLQIFWYVFVKTESDDALYFNAWQSLWALPLPLIMALWFEKWPEWASISSQAWIGLLMLTFGSTLIAFALQIRAQRLLSPTTASLIYLLESPFALLFSFLLLNERLNVTQTIGAFLILISVALATALSSTKAQKV